MEVCCFLGECVIAFTPGKWNIDEAEFDADGDENESRYLPSVEERDMYDDAARSYTPLFSIEHFLRTKSKKRIWKCHSDIVSNMEVAGRIL